ncbi:peptide deformylase [Monaibacterium marinum]|uniref:Peptide deformylase n=1 Tax=Pontivivens marinum TaxID=1690039 RepID=A0A2C9CU66_9RHOB|nr:peptide deformylase [Monaibacterium marinum]SOH95061.1 peptide deformylase [Monaibacterium marinum]
MIRPILIHPDPRLKKVVPSVADSSDALRKLADDMLATMYDAPGIGLAAPQIGVMSRIFVMDCADKDEAPAPIVMLNPEITAESEELGVYEEGCLSIPDIYAEVTRPLEVSMRWLDLNGEIQQADFGGLQATCAQHELDHLDGKLFIDYLSTVKRSMITNKMKKLKRSLAS